MTNRPNRKSGDKSMIFMGMGFEAVAAVLGGLWVGKQFDGYLGNRGLGPVIGSIALMIGWFVHLLAVLKRFDQEE